MEELKIIFAGNLIRLRTAAGWTQAELAERINYSDKSVSKWERAESIPDLAVAKAIADEFGVTLDYMLAPHDEWTGKPVKVWYSPSMITNVCVCGIWTLAVLLFLILYWTLDKAVPLVFVAAVPVTLITLLVLNSVWRRERYHLIVVSALVLSLFVLVGYLFSLFLHVANLWALVFLWLPTQAVILFSFRIRRNNRK